MDDVVRVRVPVFRYGRQEFLVSQIRPDPFRTDPLAGDFERIGGKPRSPTGSPR